jgi:hypothetical protein
MEDIITISEEIEKIEVEKPVTLSDRMGKILNMSDEDPIKLDNTLLLKVKEYQDIIEKIETEKVEKEKELTLSLIDKAIEEGKIKATQKENMITLSEANKEAFISFMNELPEVTKLSDVIAENKQIEERQTWTFSDWMKNDLEGLNIMKEMTPEKYWKLYSK